MNIDRIGDWALALLTLCALFAIIVRMQFLAPSLFCRRWAYRTMAFGWGVLSARLWIALLSGEDPVVHPLSQIGLTIVCIGVCWVAFDVVLKAHNVLCRFGQNREKH